MKTEVVNTGIRLEGATFNSDTNAIPAGATRFVKAINPLEKVAMPSHREVSLNPKGNSNIALDPITTTATLATLLSLGAKGTSALTFGLIIADKFLGTDLITFGQGVGTMAISIAADACANVISQNHKLTPKGVINYASAIGLSHAIYPLVGFAAAGLLSFGIQSGSSLLGSAGVSPEVANGIAQGLVATTIYGLGSLILFRFLSNDMIPDFRGIKKDDGEEATTSKKPSGIMGRIDSIYEKFIGGLENKLLDNKGNPKIEIFNDLDTSSKYLFKSIKTILGTLRHPEIVKCSVDSFVSTFAKMAFVGGAALTIGGQFAAIGLTSVLVFGFVLGAGYFSLKAFSKLKDISKANANESATQSSKSGFFNRLTSPVTNSIKSFLSRKAVRINQIVNTTFKTVGVGTLGYFASNAAASCITTFAKILGGSLPISEKSISKCFLALFALKEVGISGIKDFWKASAEEAEETVSGVLNDSPATV